MAFDNRDYEPVKQRKLRFYQTFPDGRISVQIENDDVMEMALVRAEVFCSKEDQEKRLPRGIGYGLEIRDKELQVTNQGKKYESVNFSSWVENCEESAIGRALDNAGFASNMKCSAEEMAKAARMSNAIKSPITQNKPETVRLTEPLNIAPPIETSQEIRPSGPIMPEQKKTLSDIMAKKNLKTVDVMNIAEKLCGKRSSHSLTYTEANELIKELQK